MPSRLLRCPLLLIALVAGTAMADPGCRGCHGQASSDHAGVDIGCVACHGGDGLAATAEAGHAGLVRSPGEMENAQASCGRCHAAEVAGVAGSVMHTGRRLVATTRRVLGAAHELPGTLQDLGEGAADSLLRKLCASCHLGQPRNGSEDPIRARGGGCLACHLDPAATPHPALRAQVSDARCVGCHSRSGRIALNYAGLAEVDPPREPAAWRGLSRLSDGRLVEHRAADVHQRAGLGCVDCHTGPGLMGMAGGVDIACTDCHDNRRPRLRLDAWRKGTSELPRQLPFRPAPDQAFLQTARGTPLWHVELRGSRLLLHPKAGGAPISIPRAGAEHVPEAGRHEALGCDACHATWAPQCHGCHVSYDPGQAQWDHAARQVTPGRWQERRWGIRNDLPPLGRDGEGKVVPVVPGMIMTLAHPEWDDGLFARRFAALSPHTTGRSRQCGDCHANARALGLGAADLLDTPQGPAVRPRMPRLRDGLAADAWTALGAAASPRLSPEQARPFSEAELRRLLVPQRRAPPP